MILAKEVISVEVLEKKHTAQTTENVSAFVIMDSQF